MDTYLLPVSELKTTYVWFPLQTSRNSHALLVAGFNPFEKSARQIGSASPGVKIKQLNSFNSNHHLVIVETTSKNSLKSWIFFPDLVYSLPFNMGKLNPYMGVKKWKIPHASARRCAVTSRCCRRVRPWLGRLRGSWSTTCETLCPSDAKDMGKVIPFDLHPYFLSCDL